MSKINYSKFNVFINIWIIVFCVLFVVFMFYFIFNKNKYDDSDIQTQVSAEEKVRFKLNGEKKITLSIDDDYVELGCLAESDINGDVSNYVDIDGSVDTSIPGTYRIIYTLKYKGIAPEVVRTIKVVEKDSDEIKKDTVENSSSSQIADSSGQNIDNGSFVDENSVVSIYLNGYSLVYLLKGTVYNDAFAKAVNKNGIDISDKIKTDGNVNVNKTGAYVITYTVSDSKNRSVSVSRTVNVVDMKADFIPSVTSYTKNDINLKINVTADMFSHIILPSGEKVTSNTYTFPVSSNGKYSFDVYNTVGLGKRYTYEIKNIDKDVPTGSCSVLHDENGSVINILANDNVGIKSYVYNDKRYNASKLTFGEYLNEGSVINIGFYDKADNYGSTSCVVPKIPDEYLIDDNNKVSVDGIPAINIKYIDATDLGCTITAGGYKNVATKIGFNSIIADQTHNIFKNVCTYVNQTPWISSLQHDGAYVNRTVNTHDYHSQGLAIDLNDLWTYTDATGYSHNPYGGQGTWTWTKYKKFICEVCGGEEDCKYNINYIIFKRYFEGNGWCWGGNWSPNYFDPMHFEVRAGGCSVANKQRITC